MRYNLSVCEVYTKDGEEKKSWKTIGELHEVNGKKFVKIYHMPGVYIGVFEEKKKDSQGSVPF